MAITIVPQLSDNFAYLISDDSSGECAVVDCAEADKVLDAVKRLKLNLKSVLTTHWHPDHSGGNADIVRKAPGLCVFGASAENGRIPALTNPVADGDNPLGHLDQGAVAVVGGQPHRAAHARRSVAPDGAESARSPGVQQADQDFRQRPGGRGRGARRRRSCGAAARRGAAPG